MASSVSLIAQLALFYRHNDLNGRLTTKLNHRRRRGISLLTIPADLFVVVAAFLWASSSSREQQKKKMNEPFPRQKKKHSQEQFQGVGAFCHRISLYFFPFTFTCKKFKFNKLTLQSSFKFARFRNHFATSKQASQV